MHTPFEKRVCLTICACQLTSVLSCVSIVYLTVAVYGPSHRLLNSGFTEDTVMCTTVSNTTVPCMIDEGADPTWSTCGEWCLSKSSGTICTQIRVDVRRNGSNLRLEGCETPDTTWCDGIDPNKKTYECLQRECAQLHGLFNCTKRAPTPDGQWVGSVCRNLSAHLECNYTIADTPILCNTRMACMNFEGLYECNDGKCAKIRPPFKCRKRCIGINTGEKNVIIRHGDIIFSSNCARAVNSDSNVEVWPLTFKSISQPNKEPVLMMFCTNMMDVVGDRSVYFFTDCFNGTLLEPGHFGDSTHVGHLVQNHQAADRILDENRLFAPPEEDLLIFNNTPLYINFDACVNSLMDECAKFHTDFGGAGSELKTQSRFQCYHQPDSAEFVVARFSRMKSIMELMLASMIPTVLAILSCFSLVLCTRIIQVEDDSHFHFQCCAGDTDAKAALANENVEGMAL